MPHVGLLRRIINRCLDIDNRRLVNLSSFDMLVITLGLLESVIFCWRLVDILQIALLAADCLRLLDGRCIKIRHTRNGRDFLLIVCISCCLRSGLSHLASRVKK